MLENYIKEIAKELELERPLTTEVPGVFVFPLNEEIRIFISNTPQGIYFESGFAIDPLSKQEELFTQLLLANLFGQGTRGAIMGISEDGKKVKISKLLFENVDYKSFTEALEDFINLIDFWIEEVLVYKV